MGQKPFIIGITGGSASGKSTFFNQLKASLTQHFVAVSQDNYYISRDMQPVDSNGVKNFDTPQSIDSEAFVKDIQLLIEGKSFSRKEYTYNNPLATPSILEYKPAPIILAEGLFLLNNPEIRELLNLSIYIEADEHLKLKRRILRDQNERGYPLDDVLYRYEHHVYPCYENHIKPYRQFADIIIPNQHGFSRALDVVISFLSSDKA